LIYGFKKSKAPLSKVFPTKLFNPLILIPITTFFWAVQNLLVDVGVWMDKVIPAPDWFWEMFNKIFESDYGWWGAFMKVAVIAPVVEELIFRGLILQGLRRNYNAFISVFMSALLFALFHLNPWQFPATFILGMLLGWIVLRTHSLLLSILGHSINNLLVLLSITYWKQISTFGIYLMDKKDFLFTSWLVVFFSLVLIYLFSFNWFRVKRQNSDTHRK
jgi:membrane protease YdiL (CAAX protease family)